MAEKAAAFNGAGFGTVAIGATSLMNSTGNLNIGIGNSAGVTLQTGDHNIYIGSDSPTSTENSTIRIGIPGTRTRTFLAGDGNISGNLNVGGTLTKGGGSFKIDHPLKPSDKYLSHSFVESPDMMNIYNGNATLNEKGEAVVDLPDWFGALNRDFRYQLTCIGGFAPVFIAEEISQNRFRIAGGRPGLKVAWQVTGIRQDAYANAHRIPLEEEKPAGELGYYLHPDAYGKPVTQGIAWALSHRKTAAPLGVKDGGSD